MTEHTDIVNVCVAQLCYQKSFLRQDEEIDAEC